MPEEEDPSRIKAAHDLSTSLRAEGYTVGFDSADIVEDWPTHVERGQRLLDYDDLGGYFVVAHRDGQTDYATSVVVNDSVAWGVVQIEMLGAHFRAVHDALPLNVDELIEAMVDEAVTIDENADA